MHAVLYIMQWGKLNKDILKTHYKCPISLIFYNEINMEG